MTKKEWIVILMQGMIGDYGNRNIPYQCRYNGEAFRIQKGRRSNVRRLRYKLD